MFNPATVPNYCPFVLIASAIDVAANVTGNTFIVRIMT
jgi:hypothetical protein